MNFDLSVIPGLRYAALINPAGQIMDSYGHSDGDATIAAVLIQAALSAAIDIGQRGGLGDCRDMGLTYANGGMLACPSADGHVLLFQYAAEAPLNTLRQQAREILASLGGPAETIPPVRRDSLMDALNAAQP